MQPLRGNVNTRLRKLDEGHYDAIILAAAGLKRLGFGDRIRDLIDPADSLPAPGQGALALECRADRGDVIAALAPLERHGHVARDAGRACVLAGACRAAATRRLAAHATWQEGTLWLRGYDREPRRQ